jgi:acyl-CoA thioester hydrolase
VNVLENELVPAIRKLFRLTLFVQNTWAALTIMSPVESTVLFRIRYSETDQMGTYYGSRALEWFEVGRTELTRGIGLSYAEMERRGMMLPVIEAHVQYLGRARYDDLLKMHTTAAMVGRARIRFDVSIVHSETGASVASGYTIHAFTDAKGKPIRPPDWFLQAMKTSQEP